MKFGVCIPNYGETTSIEGIRTVAVEAEKMGYDSVWTTDHILMPPQSGTPYEKIFETIVSLAYLAPLTSTVKLGVSALILTMRNPVVIVKQLATIDHMSGGRVILALGAGWNETEFQHLGSDFHNRGRRLDESIRLIRTLWIDGARAKFEGKRIPHKFSNVMFEPRPVQDRLTIWIGGSSKAAMKRAAQLGDAWHPNVSPLETFRKLVSEFRTFPGAKDKQICVRIGLDLKATSSEYTTRRGDRRLILAKNMSENKKVLSELEELGVTYALVVPSPEGTTSIRDQIESLQVFSENFIRKSGT